MTYRCSQRGELPIALLVFAAVSADFAIAPFLNTLAPAFSSGLLVLLLIRRQVWRPKRNKDDGIQFPETWRIAAFLTLHACGLLAVRTWQSGSLGHTSGDTPAAVALTKYLVLLPTVVLLPIAGWRKFFRLYQSECVVTLLAVLTFFPYRIFHAAWPWYSQFLGQAVFLFSRSVIPGLQLVPSSASPIINGPALDVVIISDCGGLQILKLFQILFAIVLVVDWESLNKVRTLIAYCGGLVAMLTLNLLRITFLVIVGNKWSPELIVHHHIVVSWIFPAAFLAVSLWTGYSWLFSSANVESRRLEPVLSH